MPPSTCTVAITGHHATTPREPGARRFVMYSIAVSMLRDGEAGAASSASAGRTDAPPSWRVSRRFSQFVELHQELWKHHTAALQRSGITLPAKFRLPFGGLAVEGRERVLPLDAYLQTLMASDELRRSEQLVYFLGADMQQRRPWWEAAVGRQETIIATHV